MSDIKFRMNKNTKIAITDALIYFCSTFLLFATNIMLPTLEIEFNMDLASVSWITLAFMILFVGTGLSFIQVI